MSSVNTTLIPSISTTRFIFTTTELLREYKECAPFYYNKLALMMWVTASVFCFVALLSTIHTIYHSYQLWTAIQDLETSIIDLTDEACQILLPVGVCKQICHPHHIGNVNANYLPNGAKQDLKPGTRDNRYPEDVTFPPSDIEKVYDVMGDEDTRRSLMASVPSVEEPPESVKEQPPATPIVLIPPQKAPSKELELQKTPRPSRENVLSKEALSDKKKPSVPAPPGFPVQVVLSDPKLHDAKTPALVPTPVPVQKILSGTNLHEAKTPSRETAPFRSRESLTPRGASRTPSRETGMKPSAEVASAGPRGNLSKESAVEKKPSPVPPTTTPGVSQNVEPKGN